MNIGIFGGSFNPIHIGHCIVANYLSQNTDLDEVWMNVSPQNPLKAEFAQDYDSHRINMVSLAIEPCQRLKLCDIEFTMPRPSYTIDTLHRLKKLYPAHNFHLIIGSDNWLQFNKWKEWQTIIENFKVLVYPRPGYGIDKESLSANVSYVSAPEVELSSSFIREQIKKGKNMNFFLSEKVYQYIIENKLYIK